MKRSLLIIGMFLQLVLISGCNGQSKPATTSQTGKVIGGPFENRELTYYGIPRIISARDTSPGWNQRGSKILLTGVVYKNDGKTPAPDVLLYYYQTNTEGRYLHVRSESRSMQPNDKGQTHGYIRGWVKTDSAGRYFIYTVRPGVYPTRDEPAHVHVTVKEPNDISEYWIDDFLFDDDELLTTAKRRKLGNRCGSGILRLVKKGDLLIGERNIILGLNIPDYPSNGNSQQSGRNIGEEVYSFIPYHAWGPDKGSRTCPVCKYGWYHGILYFVGNKPDWQEIRNWLVFLEEQSIKREKFLKVYFVYGNENSYQKNKREEELKKIGEELKLEKLALTFVPSFRDSESEIDLNRIDPDLENTFVLYKRSMIIDKYINLKPVESSYRMISDRLDQTINEYFQLPHPSK